MSKHAIEETPHLMAEPNHEMCARVFAKAAAYMLQLLEEDGMAIVDEVTGENYVVRLADENIVIEETDQIEDDGAFIFCIESDLGDDDENKVLH